ncbi:hypothetical protein GCM10022277_00960 [Litoribacillus peritrichatus]|uniref:O-antigen ligase-related domain-containing protein n=2 Tax=Litoribacillus peritrichatus TaxID=718191 RepID=A0ABP7LYG0_9GAMM
MVAAYLVVRDESEESFFVPLMNILIFVAGLVVFIGFLESFSSVDLIYRSQAAPGSTFSNRNFASNAIALVIPVCTWLAFFRKGTITQILIYTMVLASLFAFLSLTKTRGVLLALILGAAFCMCVAKWVHGRKLNWNGFYLPFRVFLVLSAFIGCWILSPAQKEVVKVATVDNSIQYRLDAWGSSAGGIIDKPIIGHGLGQFRSVLYQNLQGTTLRNAVSEDRQMLHAHNEYIELWVELGFIGLGLLIVFIYFLIKQIKRSYSELALFLLVGILVSLIHGFFSFPLRYGGTAIMWALIVGLYLGVTSRKEALIASDVPKAVKYIYGFLVLFVFSGVGAVGYSHLKHGSELGKVYHSGMKGVNCEQLADYERNKSEFWLNEYTAKVTYVSVLNRCNYVTNESYQTVKNLFAKDPTFIRGGLYLANIEFQLGDLNTAKLRLIPMVEHHQELVEPWLLLAKISMKEESPEDALVYLKAARASGNKLKMVDSVTQELFPGS